MDRHYGLDWLRIGAFALLILYHIGMVFVPWGYHVKLPGAAWVVVPMLATNAWRLALLFVVSGYASRALLLRGGSAHGFARNRSVRLLVPLVFGIAVVVPPQAWVELATQHGYAGSLASFWTHDYFRFGTLGGITLPTWNHLWFVLYLWVYTMALAIAVASIGRRGGCMQRGFDAVFARGGLFVLPTAYLLWISVWQFAGESETHTLFHDAVAHATYLPAFLFGFGLAGSETALATFRRFRVATAVLAVTSYAVVAGVEIGWPGGAPRPWGQVFSAGKAVQGWMTIAALIGIAEAYWNRDHRWRPMLTEAVFPFYVIHQTIIVVVGYWLRPLGWSLGANFAVLVAATVAGCWAFYLVGRSIGWLRPLIGLRPYSPNAPAR